MNHYWLVGIGDEQGDHMQIMLAIAQSVRALDKASRAIDSKLRNCWFSFSTGMAIEDFGHTLASMQSSAFRIYLSEAGRIAWFPRERATQVSQSNLLYHRLAGHTLTGRLRSR